MDCEEIERNSILREADTTGSLIYKIRNARRPFVAV